MASSRYEAVPVLVEKMREIKPKTVLDIGVGFGKVGLLIREYLEAWEDRVTPEEWDIEIIGVEGFKAYHKGSVQNIVYNGIMYIDVMDLYWASGIFNLITCIDMLEHLEKEDALPLIQKMKEHGQHVLLSIPTGPGWLRHPYGKNPLEAHVSEWECQELITLGFEVLKEFTIKDGRTVGIFYWGSS